MSVSNEVSAPSLFGCYQKLMSKIDNLSIHSGDNPDQGIQQSDWHFRLLQTKINYKLQKISKLFVSPFGPFLPRIKNRFQNKSSSASFHQLCLLRSCKKVVNLFGEK